MDKKPKAALQVIAALTNGISNCTPTQPAKESYACKGKTLCTEMVSCDEARYYLKYCPDVAIDGDGDGLPCEEQWCGH